MLNRFDREEQNRESLHVSWMQDTYNPTTKENSVPFPDYAFSKYTEYCEKQFGLWDTDIVNVPTQPPMIQNIPVKIYIDWGNVSYVEWLNNYEVIDVDKLRDETFLDLWDEFVFTKEMARHDVEKYFDWINLSCKVVAITWDDALIESWNNKIDIDKNIILKYVDTKFLLHKKNLQWS